MAKHILVVNTSYISTFETFEKAVTAQKKYSEDLANIAASFISVMSMGTISWLSTTIQISDNIINNADTVKNVLEDVAQGLSDKVISYKIPKGVSDFETSNKGPLEFKNELMSEAIESCLYIFNSIRIVKEAIVVFIKAGADLTSKGKGRIGGDKESVIFLDTYTQLVADVSKFNIEITKWGEKIPSKINKTALSKDFECSLWAKWLLRLKRLQPRIQETVYPSGGSNGKDIDIPEHDVYDNFMWSIEVTNRLSNLIDLESIGVGKDGLNSWVSRDDVKYLCDWAEAFRPKEKF